jgi:hypothetical protein
MNRSEFEARSQTGRNSYLYREALQNDYVDFSRSRTAKRSCVATSANRY